VGIRQALNEKPGVGLALTIALIFVAAVAMFFQFRGSRKPATAVQAFYSDDDGKTWFLDTASHVTPFKDSNNRQAVIAMVYKCPDGKPFVAYLMRYTEDARKAAERFQQQSGRLPAQSGTMMQNEVKKPGAKNWIRFDPNNTKPYLDVITPTCPGGGGSPPLLVRPGT